MPADAHPLSDVYDRDLERFGDDPRAVHWKSIEVQRQNFEVLHSIAPLNDSNVLDVGCGTADFLAYLQEHGFTGSYVGWDFSAGMVARCAERFPDATFLKADIYANMPEIEVDYALISGTLNDRVEGGLDAAFNVLREVYSRCRRGMAFNLLSSYVDNEEARLLYCDPSEVFSFCKRELSRYVSLRHDYAPFQFSTFVYRRYA
jgi:SAM-dependent methyltransferase